MKRTVLTITLVAATVWGAGAQDFSGILSQIEANNTTLKAMRGEADAAKAEALTGLAPDDPIVEAGYLWETSADSGNRIDLSVSQSFDFPTVYYWKRKVADGEIAAADINYAVQRKNILKEAREVCIDIVYHNALSKLHEECLGNAHKVVEAWQKKYDNGLAGIIDLNNAKMAELTAEKDLRDNEIELEAAKLELARLNGGTAIDFNVAEYSDELLPQDFEVWFADAASSSSELKALDNEKLNADSATQLAIHGWLPKLSIGYTSEKLDNSYLQGVSAGISIPLWSNAGKVKAAKAHQAAVEARSADERLQYYNSLRIKYTRALKLQQLASSFKNSISGTDTGSMLLKSLQSGQINVIDYVYGIDQWHEAVVEALSTEKDYHLLLSDLSYFAE